jgi:ribosomal protein L37AE/L43A
MSAKTSWFWCGRCGFKNHPRMAQDNTKCEQCGTSNAEIDSVDYTPAGTS